MIISWNLILPGSVEEQLNARLHQIQRPFVYMVAILLAIFFIGVQITLFAHKRYLNADQKKYDIFLSILIALCIIATIWIFFGPKYMNAIVLITRGIASIFVCYSILNNFNKKSACTSTCFKTIFDSRQLSMNIHTCLSIFISPYCDKFFTT